MVNWAAPEILDIINHLETPPFGGSIPSYPICIKRFDSLRAHFRIISFSLQVSFSSSLRIQRCKGFLELLIDLPKRRL